MKLKVFDIGSQTHHDVCFGRISKKKIGYSRTDLRLDANQWQWNCNTEASSCAGENISKENDCLCCYQVYNVRRRDGDNSAVDSGSPNYD